MKYLVVVEDEDFARTINVRLGARNLLAIACASIGDVKHAVNGHEMAVLFFSDFQKSYLLAGAIVGLYEDSPIHLVCMTDNLRAADEFRQRAIDVIGKTVAAIEDYINKFDEAQ